MVALVLLALSLHIRRIYLHGGVKQYDQTMKSQVVNCVNSSTTITFYDTVSSISSLLATTTDGFGAECLFLLLFISTGRAAASSQILAVSKLQLCIQRRSCGDSPLVGKPIYLIMRLLTGQRVTHLVVPSKNHLS